MATEKPTALIPTTQEAEQNPTPKHQAGEEQESHSLPKKPSPC